MNTEIKIFLLKIQIMHYEDSPWHMMSYQQKLQGMRREEEQKSYKNSLKLQYQQQLRNQIEEERKNKQNEKMKQKEFDKHLIARSLQNQQEIIQREKMKLFYERKPKLAQNQHQPDNLKSTENAENKKEKEYENGAGREKEGRIDSLKNHSYSQGNLLKQKKFSRDENEENKIRNRYEKSLLERKKQQWDKDKGYNNYNSQTNREAYLFQSQKKYRQHLLRNAYNEELKRQIEQRQREKKANFQQERTMDMYSVEAAKKFSNSLEKERQIYKEKNKKQLFSYLDNQVREKQKTKYEPYVMERRELQINKDLLRNSQGLVPGETYSMDPQRKKQLETIARTLTNSPTKNSSEKSGSANYLAERGKNSLV